MNIITLFLSALLFFLLTPGILVRLPKTGNKYTVAGVHALIFSLLLYGMHHMTIRSMHLMRDGFTDEACTTGTNEDGGDYMLDDNGNCNPIAKK